GRGGLVRRVAAVVGLRRHLPPLGLLVVLEPLEPDGALLERVHLGFALVVLGRFLRGQVALLRLGGRDQRLVVLPELGALLLQLLDLSGNAHRFVSLLVGGARARRR